MTDTCTAVNTGNCHEERALLLEIEREVMGSDYGVTSFTSRREAQEMTSLLDLRPGKVLLDVGSGNGWPGLFLAVVSGCQVVLTDIPDAGLRAALQRAEQDGLAGRAFAVAASGEALPFRAGVYDAICHSDVLC